jgi:beta-fructofuranosidase
LLKADRRRFIKCALITAAAAATRNSLIAAAEAAAPPWATDPRRPQYHLLPAANWMNDPNAPVFWQGSYHMFYQYNPNGAYWGDMHWGHAVSPDMVHWRHLPVAFTPTPGGPDAAGCFSGTAVVDGHRVAVLYTGVVSASEDDATIRDGVNSLRETQCLAIAADRDLTTWTKVPQPVIAAPPPGINVTGFRDPSPWRQGDSWYMVVGSGIRGKGGAILLYRSQDLHNWEYLHIVAGGPGSGANSANPVDSGDMWECPDLFPLGNQHVLIYSSQGKAYWQSGDLDPKELLFHPRRQGILDYGSFYAPKTQLDRSGNRILWGWVPETRPLAEYRASGWAGLMSLPRVLTLDDDGQLRISVAPAVDSLRKKPQVLNVSADEEQNQRQIAEMHLEQCCGEIRCTVKRGAKPLTLSLIGEEAWLTAKYDPALPGQILLDDQPLSMPPPKTGELEIHMYIDGSVVEVFVNGHVACTRRFYYSGTTAPRTGLQVAGNTASLAGLSIWQLAPISTNRLTA